MSQPRSFGIRQRRAVSLVSGISADGMEADHVVPVSRGGMTVVENCQLLTPAANRTKSNNYHEPREWQSRFYECWSQRDSSQPFLLVAVPGGGKTVAALTVAAEWKRAGSDRRIIIVAPSKNLKEQWRTEAVKLFGIELQADEFGTNFKTGFHGAALTYQFVAQNALVLRRLVHDHPTMVIFDEMHHCGDDAAFGSGVVDAFSFAKERLMLSGTPWRTQGNKIPFVRYDSDGESLSDFTYWYKEALSDDVLRWLVFSTENGEVTYDDTGTTEHLTPDTPEEDAKRLLGKLLANTGDFTRNIIRKAHDKLTECRRQFPRAAAMAACMSVDHAKKVCSLIREETGCEPCLIVSDESEATHSVREFDRGDQQWLVSVKMVSEGTDIKRLQVLCYLTNYTTDLFFRQLVGRVSRVRRSEGLDDREAYVFMPADQRLIDMASTLLEMQRQSLIEKYNERKSRENDFEREFEFESITTRHTGSNLVLIGSRKYDADFARKIEAVAKMSSLSMEQSAAAIEAFRKIESGHQPIEIVPDQHVESLEETIKTLRAQCNKAVFRYAIEGEYDFPPEYRGKTKQSRRLATIHSRFSPTQDEMSERQLRDKLAKVTGWINKARGR